ncbi:MAG: hypothetical protein ACYC4F_09895 [Armatimonadota bacterium]
MTKSSGQSAEYILRRNLPLWKPAETISDTIDFCTDARIREIIWKVDAEEFNHGFTPHELVREYAKWLEEARKAQEEAGIVFSINPWLTQNHIGRARYLGGPPEGFWWRVYPDGEESPEMACPLSPGWREWLIETHRLFAATKPDKLWLEDDFKTFIHHTEKLGCYCPAHLAAFGRYIGREIGRKELVERVTSSGKPDPIRSQWFDFLGEIMVGICRDLEKAVHKESPGTRLGLMNSWSTDGRWWDEAITVLAGPHRPLARTSLAPYEEGRATNFLPDEFDILKETACLPEGTENCPELENSLYTAYSKSAQMTRLQLMLSQVLGNSGITMNLFDMLGSPTAEEPRIGRMLKEAKPLLDGIAQIAGPGGAPRGVSIPFPKRYADTVHVEPGQGFDAFRFDGEGWAVPLQGSGIPIFLNGESRVSAITGQASLRALDKKSIELLLSRGLLLDGSAAAVLCEMGYGHLIGVEPGERIDRQKILLSAERDDMAEGVSDPAYITLRYIAEPNQGQGRLYPLKPLPGAKSASVFVDTNHQAVMPGMTLFENELGGRVAVYSFDLSMRASAGFMSWKRRRQLQKVVCWLGRDSVDLFADGGAWMMPVRRDYEDYTFIAVLNFETDGWYEVALTFEWAGSMKNLRFAHLRSDGELHKIDPLELKRDGENVIACFKVDVPPLDGIVLRLTSEG